MSVSMRVCVVCQRGDQGVLCVVLHAFAFYRAACVSAAPGVSSIISFPV